MVGELLSAEAKPGEKVSGGGRLYECSNLVQYVQFGAVC